MSVQHTGEYGERPDQAVLSVEGIDKRFAGVHALNDVSLQLYPGRVHCLAGENGSGKSTLIKVISGIEAPDYGIVRISGRAYGSLTPRLAIYAGIQVIYQDLSLFSNLTIAENISLPAMVATGHKRFKWKQARQIAQRVADQIHVDLPLHRQAGDVSIAQQQLTAICRAFVQDAQVLFMDEPTTALTPHEVDSLFHTVRILREQNVAVVFVSHKFNEVLQVSDEITVLRDGCVVTHGPVADFDQTSLSAAMIGQEVTAIQRRHSTPDEEDIALSAEHIEVSGRLHDVSFVLHHGEILGVTGLLGSGRETIAEALFGLHPITSGRIVIDGAPVSIGGVNDAINAGIGYVPDDRLGEGLFIDHSIALNIVAAGIEDIPRTIGIVLRRTVNRIARGMVETFGIKTPSVQMATRALSGGNQQRVVLAKWLVRTPKVLILNGPTVGVDVGSKREIMTLLRDISTEGTAIIVISDDVPELAQVTDRIAVMRNGTITTDLLDADITEQRILEALEA